MRLGFALGWPSEAPSGLSGGRPGGSSIRGSTGFATTPIGWPIALATGSMHGHAILLRASTRMGERVAPSAAGATETERLSVLPYVLRSRWGGVSARQHGAGGRHRPEGLFPRVLATLGYEVVTTPPSDGVRRVAAAVLRWIRSMYFGAERAAQAVEDGGVLVLIGQDSDRARLAQVLDGWRIEDQTDALPHQEGSSPLILTRAVRTGPQDR